MKMRKLFKSVSFCMCFMFLTGQAWAGLFDLFSNPVSQVQKGYLKLYSTTMTVGEAMNQLRCENKKWVSYADTGNKLVEFTCRSKRDEAVIKNSKYGKDVLLVEFSAQFEIFDGGFNDVSCGVTIYFADGTMKNCTKALNLGSSQVLGVVFNPTQKTGVLLPFNEFCLAASDGWLDIESLAMP